MSASIQLLSVIAFLAHVPIKNINEFYAGILHPLMVPAHIMTIILAGLVAARIPERALVLSRVFMLGVLLGLLASGAGVTGNLSWMAYVVMCVLGVYIAANIRYRQYQLSVVFLLVSGGVIGLDTTFDTMHGAALWLGLAGSLIGAGFVSFYVARIARKARAPWQHIAMRVVASWFVAIGVLMLAIAVSRG